MCESSYETNALLGACGVLTMLDSVFEKERSMCVLKIYCRNVMFCHIPTSAVLPELDANEFRNYLRMDEDTYICLLAAVSY